jgi:hypothetical protein
LEKYSKLTKIWASIHLYYEIALKGPIFRLFLILVIANYHIPSFSINVSRMTLEHSFFSKFGKILKIDQNMGTTETKYTFIYYKIALKGPFFDYLSPNSQWKPPYRAKMFKRE